MRFNLGHSPSIEIVKGERRTPKALSTILKGINKDL